MFCFSIDFFFFYVFSRSNVFSRSHGLLSATCRINLCEQVETHSVWDDVRCAATLQIASTQSPSRVRKLAQGEHGQPICPQSEFHLLNNLFQRGI